VPTDTDSEIDNLLRIFLGLTSKYRDAFLVAEDDLTRCAYKLRRSPLFLEHDGYVRRQFVYVLLQEDDPAALYVVAGFLLFDGRLSDNGDKTFAMMQQEGVFPRLVELITEWDDGRDESLHRKLIVVLYEMARIQALSWEDLGRLQLIQHS
jgi:hypothetical protein